MPTNVPVVVGRVNVVVPATAWACNTDVPLVDPSNVTLDKPASVSLSPLSSPNVRSVLPRYVVEFANCVLLMPPDLTSTSPTMPTLNVSLSNVATPAKLVVAKRALIFDT